MGDSFFAGGDTYILAHRRDMRQQQFRPSARNSLFFHGTPFAVVAEAPAAVVYSRSDRQPLYNMIANLMPKPKSNSVPKSRKPHYLKEVLTTRTPGQIITVDAQQNESGDIAWHAICSRREAGEWTRVQSGHGSMQQEWWAWCWAHCSPHRSTWVILANAGRVLCALDLEWQTTETETTVDSALLTERITAIKLSYRVRKLELIDARNWWAMLPEWVEPSDDIPMSLSSRSQIVATNLYQLITRSIDMVHECGLGVMQPTMGSWSSNVWRHWHRGAKVVVHCDSDAYKLERRSYYGGQVIVHRDGVLPGPWYGVDVNMMYPWAMGAWPMPRTLEAVLEECDVATLDGLPSHQGAIAECEIDSDTYAYPVKMGKYSITAHGRFRTVLAWPELSLAIQLGQIVSVGRATIYGLADLFGQWSQRIWDTRCQVREKYGKEYASLVKALSVSLHGKFAQHPVEWVPSDTPCLRPWSWWIARDKHGRAVRRRAIGEVVQEKRGTLDESPNAVPAIAAWTTSAARVAIAQLRDIVGDHSWVYQFSDTLVCDGAGLQHLIARAQIDSARLGACKIDWQSQSVEIRGPGWLLHDDRRRACGIPPDAEEIGTDRYSITAENSLAGLLSSEGMQRYKKVTRIVHYPAPRIHGTRRADGFIDPPILGRLSEHTDTYQ